MPLVNVTTSPTSSPVRYFGVDHLVTELPDTINILTGLPAVLCGVECYIEAWHIDMVGTYVEQPSHAVRVSITTVEGDHVVLVDVLVDTQRHTLLSAVVGSVLEQHPLLWPLWEDSRPVPYVHN
jgi:hypothetical protein